MEGAPAHRRCSSWPEHQRGIGKGAARQSHQARAEGGRESMPRRRAAADLSWERESRAGGRESDDGSELGKERMEGGRERLGG